MRQIGETVVISKGNYAGERGVIVEHLSENRCYLLKVGFHPSPLPYGYDGVRSERGEHRREEDK